MEPIEDKVLQPVACTIAEKDGFLCPAAKFGAEPVLYCTVYTDEAVKSRERTGVCPFKSLRKPVMTTKKKRTNPQKASKKKAKTGAVKVEDA